jgi:hypothetical protein
MRARSRTSRRAVRRGCLQSLERLDRTAAQDLIVLGDMKLEDAAERSTVRPIQRLASTWLFARTSFSGVRGGVAPNEKPRLLLWCVSGSSPVNEPWYTVTPCGRNPRP